MLLQTSPLELGSHLASLKFVSPVYSESHKQDKQHVEEVRAFRKFRNAVTSLSDELENFADPESPLARALSNIATLSALPELPLAPGLTRLVALFTSEAVEQADNQLERQIDAVRVSLDGLNKYLERGYSKRFPSNRYSVVSWNTFCVGEVLPALFEYHFGQELQVSTGQHRFRAGGPGIRFLTAATRTIGIRKTNGEMYSAEGLRRLREEARRDPQLREDWIKKLVSPRSTDAG